MPIDLLVARRGRSTSDTSPMRRATSRGAILAANALRSERHLKERARREARRCSPRGSSTSSTHSSGSPAHKGADFRLLCARCLPRVRQVPSPHSAGLVRARADAPRRWHRGGAAAPSRRRSHAATSRSAARRTACAPRSSRAARVCASLGLGVRTARSGAASHDRAARVRVRSKPQEAKPSVAIIHAS